MIYAIVKKIPLKLFVGSPVFFSLFFFFIPFLCHTWTSTCASLACGVANRCSLMHRALCLLARRYSCWSGWLNFGDFKLLLLHSLYGAMAFGLSVFASSTPDDSPSKVILTGRLWSGLLRRLCARRELPNHAIIFMCRRLLCKDGPLSSLRLKFYWLNVQRQHENNNKMELCMEPHQPKPSEPAPFVTHIAC